MWRDDEGDPRPALPLLLAIRGPRRASGAGLPLPRPRAVRGRPPEAGGGPRCVRGGTHRGDPTTSRGDSGPCPPDVRTKPFSIRKAIATSAHADPPAALRHVPRDRGFAAARMVRPRRDDRGGARGPG